MSKLIKSVIITFVMVMKPALSPTDDVVLDYASEALWTLNAETQVYASVIYTLEYDVNNNTDILIACPEIYESEGYRDYLLWRIYLKDENGNYVWHNSGIFFSPNDLVLVKENNGKMRLGYIRLYPEGRGVMPLEIDARGAMTAEGIRFIDELSAEDLEWLEAGRKAAQGLIRIYTPEDIAALKARRNAEVATHVSPQPVPPPPSDNAATPALETLPRGNAITERFPQDDASTADESVGFIDGEDRDDYRADTHFLILVIGAALLFLVGLSAIFVYRRKHTM